MTNPIHSIDSKRIRFSEKLRGGSMWSHILKRGTTLRLTDIDGSANVSLLCYNCAFPAERYNMADTLKGQHTARLSKNNILVSDMGRVLLSITEDNCGWHDTISGCSTEESILKAFGECRYQEAHNEYHRNGRDCFLTELEKWGLGERDLVANVNFFSKVSCNDKNTGDLRYWENHSFPGAFVDLRAEMDTLVVLNTCPHPLTKASKYPRNPVELTVWESDPPAADDPCRKFCPENERAFTNTERYHL